MATYSYILCTNCVGTGTANDECCPKCQGARMTGSLVDEHLYRVLDIACCDVLENDVDRSLALQQLA